MVEFILATAFFAGPILTYATGVSISYFPIAFSSEEECSSAGEKIKAAFEDKAKWAGFVCVKHTVVAPKTTTSG